MHCDTAPRCQSQCKHSQKPSLNMSYHPFGLAEALLRATTQIAKAASSICLQHARSWPSFSCLRLPAGSTPPAHLGLAKKTWRHIIISRQIYATCTEAWEGIACASHVANTSMSVNMYWSNKNRNMNDFCGICSVQTWLNSWTMQPHCHATAAALLGQNKNLHLLLQGFGALAWVGQQQHSTTFKQLVLPSLIT